MENYRKYFSHFIKDNYPLDFVNILVETDRHYNIISKDTAFAKTSKNLIDKRLDFSSYFLALIKTLDEKEESFEKIRKICLQITIEYVRPKSKMEAFFKNLFPRIIKTWFGQILISVAYKKVGQSSNRNGFIAKIVTDKKETFGLGYGIDIIECGICKLFKKHNFSKYTSLLCEIDEITSELAGLELIRTGTIANGAHICDFRFKLKE